MSLQCYWADIAGTKMKHPVLQLTQDQSMLVKPLSSAENSALSLQGCWSNFGNALTAQTRTRCWCAIPVLFLV